MKTLLLSNQKGGVGKTAVATLIAHYAHREGRRVLAIDLDHQGNLTRPLVRSGLARVGRANAGLALSEVGTTAEDAPFALLPACDDLLGMERRREEHNTFAGNLRTFLQAHAARFDMCLIDTHPNPDIRMISALVSADCLLSPIQLNQEAIDGVKALLHHPRVGFHKVKAVLNPKLRLVGLLPTMVEPTPFQRANFAELVTHHASLLIRIGTDPVRFASIPKRSSIAEAQAQGCPLWDVRKTAARDAWAEIEPCLRHLLGVLDGKVDVA